MNDTVVINQKTGRLVLIAVAVIALCAGLAMGGLALISAVGIWLGFWEFPTGFQLLGIANSWGDLVALVTFVDALGILVLARIFKVSDGLRIASIAFIGTVAAYLGYYIPETHRPPEGADVPPIHDISTDTVDPPAFVAVLPLRADAPNTTVYGGSEGITPEELASLTRRAYPDLVSVTFEEPASGVFERALAAVDELGWELVDQASGEGRIEATDTTFWFRFKDDIVIRVRESGGATVVDARSVSRVGRGDVGTNARRLRAFFRLL